MQPEPQGRAFLRLLNLGKPSFTTVVHVVFCQDLDILQYSWHLMCSCIGKQKKSNFKNRAHSCEGGFQYLIRQSSTRYGPLLITIITSSQHEHFLGDFRLLSFHTRSENCRADSGSGEKLITAGFFPVRRIKLRIDSAVPTQRIRLSEFCRIKGSYLRCFWQMGHSSQQKGSALL